MFFLRRAVLAATCFPFFFFCTASAISFDCDISVSQKSLHTAIYPCNPTDIGQDTIPTTTFTDTLSLHLDEIHVQSTRIREPLRYQPVDIQLIDSLRLAIYSSQSISEVLSRYSSLFIRDNGPGGLATLSQRGLSASQTQVLWEGFPINNLSLGLSDLSTIPSSLFHAVEVSPGTPSSTFGGGSLGGTVFLSSSQRGQQNRLELAQSAGAFGTWNTSLRSAYSSGRWSGSLSGSYHTADNDFSYINRATAREERRTHNEGRAVNLMGNIAHNRSRARVYSSFWYFDNRDNIPGTILAGNPEAVQTLEGVRWTGRVDLSARGWHISAATFLESDRFGYDDPPAGIESRFNRSRGLAEIDARRPSTGSVIWQGGMSAGLERVGTNNYREKHERQMLGMSLNPEIQFSSWKLRFSPTLRADAYSGFGWIMSPSLGGNWEILDDRLYMKGMVSYDFNPPSFNDLYWVPGGNPGLDAERSLKTEGGFLFLPEWSNLKSLHLTGYRIWLDNGIYWFPDHEGTWSPSNVEELDAYGAEILLGTNWQLASAEFSWNLGLDWRRSKMARERFPGDQGVGRQMRYVPEWAFRSDLSIQLSRIILHANYRWTDRRYITSDHTSSLDGFHILDTTASLEQPFLSANWLLMVSVSNMLNEQYEIIQWYPMPGRHINLTLRMELPI